MEIYENTVGVHTFELNLRLSGFDEYRERAAQLYDEASDILNESGKGVYHSFFKYDAFKCCILLVEQQSREG